MNTVRAISKVAGAVGQQQDQGERHADEPQDTRTHNTSFENLICKRIRLEIVPQVADGQQTARLAKTKRPEVSPRPFP